MTYPRLSVLRPPSESKQDTSEIIRLPEDVEDENIIPSESCVVDERRVGPFPLVLEERIASFETSDDAVIGRRGTSGIVDEEVRAGSIVEVDVESGVFE